MTLPSHPDLGPYTVEELLGSGGFATVFRCRDERLDSDVAIKVLADNHTTDPDVRSRFLREGRALRQIDNPFVIRVHDVGETDRGQPYLVLEYADRGDLLARVTELRSQGWKPSSADVACVAEAMLGAASALHVESLVHRDLKPDNVLIRSTTTPRSRPGVSVLATDERIVVSDLGLVKDLAENSGLTVAGGSRKFGAPEQFAGRPVTPRTDVYAAARVLQWLTAEGVADDTGWHDALNRKLAPALSDDPAQRPASADELAVEVKNALTATVGPAAPEAQPARVTAAEERAGQRSTGKGRFLLGWAALAALFVAVFALMQTRSQTPQPTVIAENRGAIEAFFDDGEIARIEGPLSIPVGTKADFDATVPAGAASSWVLPDGSELAETESISVLGESPGSGVVTLRVSNGVEMTELAYQFDVE